MSCVANVVILSNLVCLRNFVGFYDPDGMEEKEKENVWELEMLWLAAEKRWWLLISSDTNAKKMSRLAILKTKIYLPPSSSCVIKHWQISHSLNVLISIHIIISDEEQSDFERLREGETKKPGRHARRCRKRGKHKTDDLRRVARMTHNLYFCFQLITCFQKNVGALSLKQRRKFLLSLICVVFSPRRGRLLSSFWRRRRRQTENQFAWIIAGIPKSWARARCGSRALALCPINLFSTEQNKISWIDEKQLQAHVSKLHLGE